MKQNPSPIRCTAFSLIEILISIGVVSVLATLLIGASQKAQSTGLRADAMARMRQIGMAVQSYANDNDGSLPGPLWSGQSPWYTTDLRTIGARTWSYIGAPEPRSWSQEAELFSTKAYVRAVPKKDANAFLFNQGVNLGGSNVAPWGYPGLTEPLKMVRLVELGLSKTWAVQDLDQTHKYLAPGTTWISQLPAKPLYNPYRLTLFFDWHVEAEPID